MELRRVVWVSQIKPKWLGLYSFDRIPKCCGCGCSEPGEPEGLGVALPRLATSQLLPETHGAPPSPGFNLRIRRPKGPRDPPAEWTQA